MNRLRRLGSTLRYTRRRQWIARVRLALRRFALGTCAPFLPVERRLRRSGDVREARELAEPLFRPRRHLVRQRGLQAWAQLPGAELELRIPMDWSPRPGVEPRLCRDELLRGLHRTEFLEEVDDRDFMQLVDDWIEQNAPYSSADWRRSWDSQTLAVRVVVWMQQWAARRSRLDVTFVERVRRSIVSQLRHLMQHLDLDVGGAPLLKDIKALLWGASCFDGAEPDSWRARALDLLDEELREQILPDGLHYSRSHSTHLQVFADLLEIHELLDASPLLDRLTQRLHAMAQAAVDLTHPDGQVSLFNDSGLNASYRTDECLRAYAAITGRTARARALFALSSSGFFGVRRGPDLLVVDCGDNASDHHPAHGHADALGFEWSVGGRRVIVDAGVAEHEEGEMRSWSRSTRAHNTVTLDHQDQCELYGSFGMARRATVTMARLRSHVGSFILEGSHTGYRHLTGEPVPVRRFTASPMELLVEDRVEGGEGQVVHARLLLHPEAKVHVRDDKLTIVRGRTLVRLHTSASLRVVRGYWCPDLGVSLPTQQIELTYGEAPCHGSFRLEAIPSKQTAAEVQLDQVRELSASAAR